MAHILELLRVGFAHHIIFSAGLLLIMGFILGQLSERIKLPAITGYIFAGILLGEAGLNLIHHENLQQLNILSEITLSFIAVIIGCEFSFAKLRLYGKRVILLTLVQMFLTFFMISIGLIILGLSTYVSFLLGTIGAATAPAATVVIVEKLRAKGEFVDYLYGIVALDDAGTVILFSIVFAISGSVISGLEVNLLEGIFNAFKEIFFSLLSGAVGGLLIHYSTRKSHNLGEMKIITLGIIFLTTSICLSLHLSPLISNMTIGMLLVNLSRKNIRILNALQPLTPPLYALFFTIAGTELDLKIFTSGYALLAGLVFIIMRAIGKYGGVFATGHMLRLPNRISNWLGLALLPQAGVAIGLVLFVQGSSMVKAASPEIQLQITEMINIVLMSVFFNELLGPPLAKIAIKKNLRRR
ncbi:MAG: cation:proton antiporter [Candidatus Cloacimonetes bacterium]|nr:cation:proton antiporter [Candidatus Cloacimonadota bacterium]